MKTILGLIVICLFLSAMIAGCTAPQTTEKPVKAEDVQSVAKPQKEVQKTSNTSSTSGASGADRYYYNIRIVPPSALTTMEKEIGPDEYLIRNENGDLIGVVSPRELFLRGDLMQLQQSGGKVGKDFDKTDISNHLIEIAYGFDNAKLTLFKSDKDYKFWFDAYYTQSDLDDAFEFAKFFNSISDTTQFEDEEVALGFLSNNYAEIPYNFYNIKIVPEKMLDDFKDKRAAADHLMKKQDGSLIGIASSDHLYLIDSLNDKDRNYYIKKGILYSMGLHGTTFNDQESFFYREEGITRNLSPLDTQAIKLLYGGRLKSGMDLEEAKKTLGLSV
ncbi:MAG TPA: hypothetical protein VN372_14925 [Methanospirillum sp.]|nr:hypothetical protein [Methanospirillum sp.]